MNVNYISDMPQRVSNVKKQPKKIVNWVDFVLCWSSLRKKGMVKKSNSVNLPLKFKLAD